MITSRRSYSRSIRVGLGGFILGGIIGALATYLIFSSGTLSIAVNLISQDQPFVQYLFGIVLAFLGIGMGGAIDGLICGYTLHLIDPEGSEKRYLLGGAFSTGISQAILVIPILLFISLLSIYNVGSPKDPASFIILFALIGGLFGLINGAILSLVTLRLRYAWISWLGYFFASLVGGALFGLLLWKPEWISSTASNGLAIPLFLMLAGIMIYGSAGGVLGVLYEWLSRKRDLTKSQSIEPKRWQDISIFSVAIVIILAEVSLINHLANFVTIYPGNVTTSLNSKTKGVHWQASQKLSSDLPLADRTTIGLAAGPQGIAAAWSNISGEILLAYQQSDADGITKWSSPINVSMSSLAESIHPQVAIGSDGDTHIVWSENNEIWYNHCQSNKCEIPAILTRASLACAPGSSFAQNEWPAIALTRENKIMIVWHAGEGSIGYATWEAKNDLEDREAGCIASGITSVSPRLATSQSGNFWMVLSGPSDSPGMISLVNFHQGSWGDPEVVGVGSNAEVFTSENGTLHTAWCGFNKEMNYLAAGKSKEVIDLTPCQNRPSLFEDINGRIHLVYATNQWEDNHGTRRSGNSLMETIRDSEEWSVPAIVAPLSIETQQEVAGFKGGNVELLWIDMSGEGSTLWHSNQPAYQCDESSLSGPMQAIISVVQNGNFHPADYQPPFCGNHFDSFIYMPKPSPEYAILPSGEEDGFDQVADLIKNTQYEVLFSTMQWDMDKDNLSPGSRIARAIAEIYHQVKTNPEAYPRGLTVKILLGNYPNLSTLEMGDQIWNILQDLGEMGVETMEDPSIGWKIEVANYKGSFPHSHTKFIVVDGKTLMAAGFNIAWDHLPKDNPSGKGIDMTDLGIVLSGPVAQTGITVFDEMWQGANQVKCENLFQGDLKQLKSSCNRESATISHSPESMKFFLPGDSANAVALYRTADYKESDDAYHAALASAQSSIDAFHANFTADLICAVNLIFPGVCNYNNSLPYMQALVEAIEHNGVYVRVLLEKENMNGLENQVGIQILQDELNRRNLEDHLEIRFYNGRVHTKSVMIDNRLLIIGSQNFHYSSISEGGLNELNLVTDDSESLAIYQDMFEYYWQQAVSGDELK
jgi:phosphatidylserine/phosphatidylglycerophosphate/cardiolipin synthase-like enzyme/MFS family permease